MSFSSFVSTMGRISSLRSRGVDDPRGQATAEPGLRVLTSVDLGGDLQAIDTRRRAAGAHQDGLAVRRPHQGFARAVHVVATAVDDRGPDRLQVAGPAESLDADTLDL